MKSRLQILRPSPLRLAVCSASIVSRTPRWSPPTAAADWVVVLASGASSEPPHPGSAAAAKSTASPRLAAGMGFFLSAEVRASRTPGLEFRAETEALLLAA